MDAAIRDAQEIKLEQEKQEQQRTKVIQQLEGLRTQAKEQADASRRDGSRTPRRKTETAEAAKPDVPEKPAKAGDPVPPGQARG